MMYLHLIGEPSEVTLTIRPIVSINLPKSGLKLVKNNEGYVLQ